MPVPFEPILKENDNFKEETEIWFYFKLFFPFTFEYAFIF